MAVYSPVVESQRTVGPVPAQDVCGRVHFTVIQLKTLEQVVAGTAFNFCCHELFTMSVKYRKRSLILHSLPQLRKRLLHVHVAFEKCSQGYMNSTP